MFTKKTNMVSDDDSSVRRVPGPRTGRCRPVALLRDSVLSSAPSSPAPCAPSRALLSSRLRPRTPNAPSRASPSSRLRPRTPNAPSRASPSSRLRPRTPRAPSRASPCSRQRPWTPRAPFRASPCFRQHPLYPCALYCDPRILCSPFRASSSPRQCPTDHRTLQALFRRNFLRLETSWVRLRPNSKFFSSKEEDLRSSLSPKKVNEKCSSHLHTVFLPLLSSHQTSKLNVMCLPSRLPLATNWLEVKTLPL